MITIEELCAYNRKLVDENLKLRKENENLKKRNSDEECLKRLAKKGYIKFCAKTNEWHKVADGDLPKRNCENILLYNKDHFCVTHSYSLGYYENGVFYNDCEMEEDTIAWCEIPLYEEE